MKLKQNINDVIKTNDVIYQLKNGLGPSNGDNYNNPN